MTKCKLRGMKWKVMKLKRWVFPIKIARRTNGFFPISICFVAFIEIKFVIPIPLLQLIKYFHKFQSTIEHEISWFSPCWHIKGQQIMCFNFLFINTFLKLLKPCGRGSHIPHCILNLGNWFMNGLQPTLHYKI